MDSKRLLILLDKYEEHSCSQDELQELEAWYDALNMGNQFTEPEETLSVAMLQQFRQKLAAQSRVVPLYRKTIFRVAAAAAVIVFVTTIAWFVIPKHKGEPESIAVNQQSIDIKAPDATKAYITLSDGKIVYLESVQNGTIAKEGNTNINKNGDQLFYTSNQQPTAGNVSYNTLTVPKGSKPVKLILADGTEMWLDAATTVTYPNVFVGKERNVEIITGQAYFEVAHNKNMPFHVKKGEAVVEVLGTHFNVSAFDNEDMKVTLLEGSVRVTLSTVEGSQLNTHDSGTIKPGQQAIIQHSAFNIQNNIDLDAVMAWKNGNFQFEGADINTVMRQLSRWYDVQVEVKGNIKEHFGGTISRESSVAKVFEMLKLTGEINYKIDGRRIIVTP